MADQPDDTEQGGAPPPDPEIDDTDIEEPDADEASDEGDDEGADGADGDGESPAGGTQEGGQAGPRSDAVAGRTKPNATGRIQELARNVRAAEERAIRAEERAAAAERAAHERRHQESEAAERERLALMTPEERYEHQRAKDRQDFDQRMRGMEFRAADRADKADFRALCAEKPAFAAVRDEVEVELAAARRNGDYQLQRETLATFLIGRKAIQKAENAVGRQRAKGAERIARQTTQPRAPRSDVGGERGRRGPADERAARLKRLENATF